MTQILETNGKLDERAISDLEKERGINLPESYKKFLMEFNGGRPVPSSFNFKDGTNGSTVDWFLGLHGDEYTGLPKVLKIYEKRIPHNYFPIAIDPGDNLICISVQGPDRGSIHFWDHEMESRTDASYDYSNTIPIADNFDEFIESLHTVGS
jgi:hypothetical protein